MEATLEILKAFGQALESGCGRGWTDPGMGGGPWRGSSSSTPTNLCPHGAGLLGG